MSISQHFLRTFFIQKQILQLFSNYCLALWLFGKWILSKRVHIKLMKFTTGVNFINILRPNFLIQFFYQSQNITWKAFIQKRVRKTLMKLTAGEKKSKKCDYFLFLKAIQFQFLIQFIFSSSTRIIRHSYFIERKFHSV